VTRRTSTANLESCALVLGHLVDQVNGHPLAPMLIKQRPEYANLLAAGTAALAGVQLERIACRHSPCRWVGLFPVRNPEGFRCARCRGTSGEAVP
jgi:hypothetical protein